jgi:general secretion pathway protein D
MVLGNSRSVRSIVALAGVAGGVCAMPALAQQTSGAGTSAIATEGSTPDLVGMNAASKLDAAAALLTAGKATQAQRLLLAITSPSSVATLTNKERARADMLLANTQARLRKMSPIERSLDSAEDALSRGDLRTAEGQADAVTKAPKATNEQSTRARELITQARTRRAELDGSAGEALDAAVRDFDSGHYARAKAGLDAIHRSGVSLSADQRDELALYQARLVELENARGEVFELPDTVDLGMLQPGVVRRREPVPLSKPVEMPVQPAPSAPAPAPTPAPASVQPVMPAPVAAPAPAPQPEMSQPVDLIEMARRVEAENLIREADAAFDAGRVREAAEKYSRATAVYANQLTGDQRQHAENRLAESRLRLDVSPAGSGGVLGSLVSQNQVIKDQTVAEFNNDLTQARRALETGDVPRARDLAARANLRMSTARQLFSTAEIEAYEKEINDFRSAIDASEATIASDEARDREDKLRDEAAKAAQESAQGKARKIDESLARVRSLQQEQKYEEALQVVEQILFLDPINPSGLVLRDTLRDVLIFRRSQGYEARKERSYIDQELQNEDAMVAPSGIMGYPDDWANISYRRGEPIAFADSEENRRSLAVLESKRIPVAFNDTPLQNIVGFLSQVTNLNIDVDWQSLEQVGINADDPVTLNLTNVPVKTVLDRVIEKVGSSDPTSGAAWSITDGVLTIASREVINKNKVLVIYDIRDLLIEIPDYPDAPELDLQNVLQQSGQGGGGGGRSPFEQPDDEDREGRTLQERTDELIDIITTNVDQQGWQENGGEVGFIQQLQGQLIITNTPSNHRQIFGLLSKLREVRAMQINVETRFLLVSQDFFEQIGFDLDVYFNTDNNQVRAARAQRPTTRANDFFDPVSTRLSPTFPTSGTGSNSLRTPLPSPLSVVGAPQNSLGLAEGLIQSDFASDILGQAPALGVAGQFLDDIQVDFLVKATQADRRTVGLTAPRLTFTNGQIANIYVVTQISFVSDLQPVVSESAVGFDPDLAAVSEGVVMLVEGTVSADRRYVTMNIDAAVSRVDGFVDTPVTAVAGGQLVNSAATQSFIQRPTVTVTRVQTTVTVPDQGTILMGGQRLTTESESESGVPVLSKIPILNRFFTNRVVAKSESTLLILVKPTVLIQNEQEEQNFPGLAGSISMPFGN